MEIINFIKIIDFYILGFDRFSFVSLIRFIFSILIIANPYLSFFMSGL
jgi:hypothetical protein